MMECATCGRSFQAIDFGSAAHVGFCSNPVEGKPAYEADNFDLEIHNEVAVACMRRIKGAFATPEEMMICVAHIAAGLIVNMFDDTAHRVAASITICGEIPGFIRELAERNAPRRRRGDR
jgi:hypothetical protein